MRLEKNNNHRILYRIAKSNLLGKKLYSFFTVLTIFVSITFVSVIMLFLIGKQTAEKEKVEAVWHTMFYEMSQEQMKQLSEDARVEVLLPYKYKEKQFSTGGVAYSFYYYVSYKEPLFTYVPAKGRVPEAYGDIVVDKKFMESLGDEISLGSVVSLPVGDEVYDFTICGYTENDYETSVYPIYVSEQFAEQSEVMKDVPYSAVIRLNGAEDMGNTEFETVVFQLASEYQIERRNINMNGNFEDYLRMGNSDFYTLAAVSILILCAGAVVIYSIFFLSVASRVQQIGQLQTIGMTQKQLKKMIRLEGAILSLVAILPGLLFGGILAWILEPDGFHLINYLTAAAVIGCLGGIIVQISIQKPVSIASKVSPIEAAKNSGDGEKEEKPQIHKKLSPFRLAVIETGKSKKKWGITTLSLAIGGVVFMAAATVISSWNEENYSRQDKFIKAEYNISYLYDAHGNPKTYGITELQLAGQLNEELREKLLKIPHVKEVEVKNTTFGIVEYQGVSLGEVFGELTENSDDFFSAFSENNITYSNLAERDAVLITQSNFFEKQYGINFQPGEKIILHWFDGEEHSMEMEIAGVTPEAISNELDAMLYITDKTMKKLWNNMNLAASFRITAENYQKNGLQVEQEIRAILENSSELALSTLRERKLADSASIQQLNLQIYGISALVILFSVFNLINTVISSISTRKKELSMLESIGMEERQIRHMLFWESIFLALPNLFLTLTVGTAGGAAIVAWMDYMGGYMDYRLPLVAGVLYIAGMLVIPVLISYLCLKGQNRTALVERIRTED